MAAHPDDEVLGCGGTIARLAGQGAEVHVAILAEGITSRYGSREEAPSAELEALHAAAERAGEILGAASVRVQDFPDNRMDTVATLDVVQAVEQLVGELRPEALYTHRPGDVNVDHDAVHRAVMAATRPTGEMPVRSVYAFEVPSSTEWAFATRRPFAPTRFVDIAETLERKIEAMQAYESEARPFPHPRSPEALRALARWRGAVANLRAAEAFEVIREIV